MLEKEITNATDQIDQVGVAFRSRPGVVVPQRTTPAPRVGAVHLARTRPELASRLVREKEHTRLGDSSEAVAAGLAWVPVDKEYRFDTGDGERAELFDGRSQLLVYHFMFGPSYLAVVLADGAILNVASIAGAALPPIVEQNAGSCGTDIVGYLTEAPGPARSRVSTGPSATPTRPRPRTGVPHGLLPECDSKSVSASPAAVAFRWHIQALLP